MSNDITNFISPGIDTTQIPILDPESQPDCGSCTNYVHCQGQFINSINRLNTAYYEALKKEHYSTELQNAVDTMLDKADNLKKFMNCNPSILKDYGLKYNDILKKRQELNNSVDILKSMNGAPKPYNTPDNIYDEYKINYNTSIYVAMMVSILAVVLIYIYFRNL
jgi:hypothetical protein